jgi:orotidine-5'-phosphate decarboxylase
LSFDAHPRSSLIVALDFDSLSTALSFAKKIAGAVGMLKIGGQLFTAAGPDFLDLKFHDIPNTVAGAVMAAASLPGVQLMNIHASGGTAMMHAAVQAISAGVPMGADRPRLLAVTLLTSLDAKAIREVGIGGPPITRVVKLAKLAQKSGVDGVVASVQEAKALRKACGRDFLIVTPGVRWEDKNGSVKKDGGKKDDQARTATAFEAIRAGADYIVVGRPILTAADPQAAAQKIVEEIAAAKA